MPKKKKWKKVLIIVLTILIILIIGRIIYLFLGENNEPITSVNDFESVKELVEYNECEYIRMANSTEEGYEKDIYIEFSKDPIESDGNVNKVLYDNLTSQIAGKLLGTNFRIIDESRNIIIRIQFEGNTVNLYTINNDSQYFEHLKTQYQVGTYEEDSQTPIAIQSNELNAIVNNNWSVNNLNLGSIDSIVNNYDIYFDEGYKIRNLYSNVFNIIFIKNYTNEVFPGITTGMTNEQIQSVLGNPTYTGNASGVIGYKNEEFYAFFYDGEISIYRNDQTYSTDEFLKILNEYNDSGDYNKFVEQVTNLWRDYDSYTKTKDRVILQYTLKGIRIDFNSLSNNGVTVYKNCKGELAEQIKGGSVPANVYTNLDTDLVFQYEDNRVMQDMMYRHPVDPIEELYTEDYVVIYEQTTDGGMQNIRFFSRNKEKIDLELKDIYINSIYKLDENNYIYAIYGRGIYRFNIETHEYQTIIEGNQSFNINKIENNIIYYDNTQIEI